MIRQGPASPRPLQLCHDYCKAFSTSEPLGTVLRARSAICEQHHMELELRHVPGKRNGLADTISRWGGAGDSPLPSLVPGQRVHISLKDLLEAVV